LAHAAGRPAGIIQGRFCHGARIAETGLPPKEACDATKRRSRR
jgi:hypothetical protein